MVLIYNKAEEDETTLDYGSLRKWFYQSTVMFFIENCPDFKGQTNWLSIQLAMAVICCCLPTYRPILPNGTATTARLVGLYSPIGLLILRKQSPAVSSTNGSRTIGEEPHSRFQHDFDKGLSGHGDKGDMSVTAYIVGGVERVEDHVPTTDYPMNAIKVTKTVDLV